MSPSLWFIVVCESVKSSTVSCCKGNCGNKNHKNCRNLELFMYHLPCSHIHRRTHRGMHMHTHPLRHKHTRMHARTHTDMHVPRAHTHTYHTHTHVHTHTHTHTEACNAHTYTHRHKHTHRGMHMHTDTNTHKHACTHALTRTCTHTQTCMRCVCAHACTHAHNVVYNSNLKLSAIIMFILTCVQELMLLPLYNTISLPHPINTCINLM